MNTKVDLVDKIYIINQSTLDDLAIMDNHYTQLINKNWDTLQSTDFIILKSTTQHRIKELISA